MAIPNDYIDKITNKDSGESRIISPAADKVRVDNENFEGTDLDEVLDEVAAAINEAGIGDGTVTGVKMNNGQPIPPDENGVVDLGTVITDVSNKVDKVTGYGLSKNDYTDADKTAVGTIPSKANDADVVKSVSVNGTAQQKSNGNVNIVVPSGGLTEEDISVETQGDGTVDINVGNDTYTINLNHTHEHMAKLEIVDDEPSNPALDTIYAQVDDAETPTEIQSLWIAGLEFVGGGAVSGPRITKPTEGSTINVGNIASGESSVTAEIQVKGKDLTQPLTVSVTGTGFSVNKQTITVADAHAGTTLEITYNGSALNATGELTISSNEVSRSCNLFANEPTYSSLSAVKLTGTQFVVLDYYTNPNTKLVMDIQFEQNANKNSTSAQNGFFGLDAGNTVGTFAANFGSNADQFKQIFYWMERGYVQDTWIASYEASKMFNRSTWTYNNNYVSFLGVTTPTETKTTTQTSKLIIGGFYSSSAGEVKALNRNNLIVYSITISENGTTLLHLVPKLRSDNVAGLYDTINNKFYVSGGENDFVAIS